MHDIRAICSDPAAFVAALERRPAYADKAKSLTTELVERDEVLRALQTILQRSQARRNEASKEIGIAKAKKDEARVQELMQEVNVIKQTIQEAEQKERVYKKELNDILAEIPNLPAADVPDGADESANLPVAARAFESDSSVARKVSVKLLSPKQHFEIGEALGQMDFERAAKVSGARFVYLKGDLARLERAIANFMLDNQTQKFGYIEVSPPVLVRDQAMFGTGQLPKFYDDQFAAVQEPDLRANFLRDEKISRNYALDEAEKFGIPYARTLELQNIKIHDDPARFWLIPTAEVPLTNYVADEILNEAELPLRMTAFTPCFRAEAGAAGKDTRGMIRMHQFSKVELVSITTPEQSPKEHERMTDAAQEILKQLDLAHRVVTLCTGDMGFSAEKTYDIEVWLPGQNAWREISSCSNCGAFQARRMNSRYRNAEGKVKGQVHTLNGSGLAVGRTMVAILENYQQADGSVAIPSVLQPYMGGKQKISKS